MLVAACEEVIEQGETPETDAAVALLTGRIGFSSPADTMSHANWTKLIELCRRGMSAKLEVREELLM